MENYKKIQNEIYDEIERLERRKTDYLEVGKSTNSIDNKIYLYYLALDGITYRKIKFIEVNKDENKNC